MLVQFVEYDQRAHRLITLASFSFYVASTSLSRVRRLQIFTDAV